MVPPIPDREGNVVHQEHVPLSERKTGDRVRFCAVSDSSMELLLFLNEKGITLGTEFDIIKVEAFDKSMVVQLNNDEQMTFSRDVCQCLMTETS